MSSEYERKFIILGKTGNGKSSLGNVFLKKQAFDQADGINSVTQECKLEREDGRVSVVDTPGLFSCDGDGSIVKQALEVQKAIKLCPNPHAFLIVLNGSSRFTQEDLSSIGVLRVIFGDQCLEKAIIVLTHIKNTVGETQVKEMLDRNSRVSHLIGQCGGRYARIDNTEPMSKHIESIKRLVDDVSEKGKKSFKNKYIQVHAQEMQKSLKNFDSGSYHEQIERLCKQIKAAVEEKKEFEKMCWKVAGVCVLCVTAGVAYCARGATTAATGHNASLNVAAGLGHVARFSH